MKPILGVSLLLTISELLTISCLYSISIWLFDQTIFSSVHILYYGCISPLSFSEIHRKITSNHLLQPEIVENCSTRPFYHADVTSQSSACYVYEKNVIIMIPHTKFWWFRTRILENDRTSSAFNFITILSVWSKRYRDELGWNNDTPSQYGC